MKTVKEQDLNDRLDRARSWLEATNQLSPDQTHEKFICLYIAFNCMYGRRQYEGNQTQVHEDLEKFLDHLQAMREQNERSGGAILTTALWSCRRDCEALIGEVFQIDDYFKPGSALIPLRRRCEKDQLRAKEALDDQRYEDFIKLVFYRLTVLRNQVMHGGVKHGSKSKGRDSLDKGLRILQGLIPIFHQLMTKYGHHVKWDPIPYPRLDSPWHPERGKLY